MRNSVRWRVGLELLLEPCGALKVVRSDRSTMLILPTCDALWVGSTSSVSTRWRLGLEVRDISASWGRFCEHPAISGGVAGGVFCSQAWMRSREDGGLCEVKVKDMVDVDRDARALAKWRVSCWTRAQPVKNDHCSGNMAS